MRGPKATLSRREFLRQSGAAAVVTMPVALAGCQALPVAQVSEPLPENPFADWFAIDQASLARYLATLTSNGADFADLFFQHQRRQRLQLRDGELSTPVIDIEHGAGLRVLRGSAEGFAATEDLGSEALAAAALHAAAGAPAQPAVAPRRFVDVPPGDRYLTDADWSATATERIGRLLHDAQERVRKLDSTVTRVAIDWEDSDERVLIATLDGQMVTDYRPLSRLTLVVTAERNGQQQSSYSHLAARAGIEWYRGKRLQTLAETAVRRTDQLFESRRPKPDELPVVLAAGSSAVWLHEAIGHGFEADHVLAGSSPYRDRLGERITHAEVTLIDDATVKRQAGALNVDDEGLATGQNPLLQAGRVSGFLHDRRTAAAAATDPTGSGRRATYRDRPLPRMTCTSMAAGSSSPEEILAAVERGILCETLTDGKVQLANGDFSFNVQTGWLIEKGRKTAPLKNFTISGNGAALLERVSMVGNDPAFDPGGWSCRKQGQKVPVSFGMPTILLASATVGPRNS